MRTRHSPLRDEHRALGAKFIEFGGWEMPLAYPSGTIAEHLACRRHAAVFDVSHLGTIRVTGSLAWNTVQRVFTNDITRIGPGFAQYTHLLDDEDGSVLDDCIIWWVDHDRFDVMPNASNTSRVLEATRGVDVTDERAVIAIQGPAARKTVRSVLGEAADVPHNAVRRFSFDGVECIVAGTGYTGEDGIECAVPVEIAPAFWRAVVATGVTPAGLGARDTLRLEAGLPLHGHELGPGITPFQAGLGWVVSFDKGRFIGRDAVIAEKAAGVERRLRGLVSSSRRPPHPGDAVALAGEEIGVVTSGNYSPLLETGIALCFVPPNLHLETEVEIVSRSARTLARVVRPPFTRLIDPAASAVKE